MEGYMSRSQARVSARQSLILTAAGLVLGLSALSAHATTTVFQGDLAGFTAAAGGSVPTFIDFDSTSGNIAGNNIVGVTFSSPDGNTLEVVPGASTFTPPGFAGVIDADTNRLFPTSGANLLSPGGSELAPGPDPRQSDSLQLDFTYDVNFFGLDVLFQSYDCCTFVSYAVYDTTLNLLASGALNGNGGGGGAPGGSLFFGVFSDSSLIGRIVFTESDGDAQFPDANIGYDTFRYAPIIPGGVPEPGAWAMMTLGLGLAGAVLRRRRAAGENAPPQGELSPSDCGG
jgi:hypothetical protein